MKIFSLLFFLSISINVYCQCLVDLGPDLISCPEDTVFIGQNLTASGLTAPLSYAWETHKQWQIGTQTYHFYASDFIDDTTIVNPHILAQEEGVLKFKLTVTDVNGLACSDSVSVYFSQFVFTLAAPKDIYINEGDSVFCQGWQNIFGTVPPFKYLWSPTTGLKDSTSLSFWAKPNTTTLYSLIVSDSLGCSLKGPGSYRIHVKPLNVAENFANQFSVYPNPANDKVRIKNTSGFEMDEVAILDLSGRVVLEISNLVDTEIDLSVLYGGAYVLQLKTEQGLVHKKIVVY